jgi:hypothetical protein
LHFTGSTSKNGVNFNLAKAFVPIGFFTDSLLGIYTCLSPGLSKWGEKGNKRKGDVFPAKFEKK